MTLQPRASIKVDSSDTVVNKTIITVLFTCPPMINGKYPVIKTLILQMTLAIFFQDNCPFIQFSWLKVCGTGDQGKIENTNGKGRGKDCSLGGGSQI